MSLRRLGALALVAGLGLSAGCSLSRNDCGERPGLFSRLRGTHGTPCCNGGEMMDYGSVVTGPALPPAGGDVPYPPPNPALLPILVLLLCTAPVLSLLLLLGGIDPEQVVQAMLVLLAHERDTATAGRERQGLPAPSLQLPRRHVAGMARQPLVELGLESTLQHLRVDALARSADQIEPGERGIPEPARFAGDERLGR